jgi:deoxyribonuclease V
MKLDIESFLRSGVLVAVDVAYDARRDFCFAGMVLWDVAPGRVLSSATHAVRSTFPYVPGLLSFREIPPLIPLFARLRRPVDLILCDGQGVAHPRRFGLACHLGVIFDRPSLGWAKTRLIGQFDDPGDAGGSASPLMDRGEQIGWALRSRAGCRPTYVSPGHALGMDDALGLARALTGRYRLCEPARAAHALTRLAMEESSGSSP